MDKNETIEAGGHEVAGGTKGVDGLYGLGILAAKAVLFMLALVVVLPLLIPILGLAGGLALGLMGCMLGLVLGVMGMALKFAIVGLKLVFGLAGLAISLVPLLLVVAGIMWILEKAGDRKAETL